MKSANYSTAQLADVDDRYYYGVSCQSCMRAPRISLTKLPATLGDDYPLVKVVTRLKCRTCGSKQVTVTFLAPHEQARYSLCFSNAVVARSRKHRFDSPRHGDQASAPETGISQSALATKAGVHVNVVGPN